MHYSRQLVSHFAKLAFSIPNQCRLIIMSRLDNAISICIAWGRHCLDIRTWNENKLASLDTQTGSEQIAKSRQQTHSENKLESLDIETTGKPNYQI